MSSIWGVDAASVGTALAYLFVITCVAGIAHYRSRDTFAGAAAAHIRKFPFFPLSFEFLFAAGIALLLIDGAGVTIDTKLVHQWILGLVILLWLASLLFVAFDLYDNVEPTRLFIPCGLLFLSLAACNYSVFEKFIP